MIGLLVGLWLILQAMPASPPPPALETTVSGELGTSSEDATVLPFATRPQRSNTSGLLLTALLLMAALGGVWYVKKRKTAGGLPSGPFEVMGKHTVAPGQQVQLVRCGGEVLLLGIGGQQVTLLKSYAADAFATPETAPIAPLPAATPQAVRPQAARPQAAKPDFSALLKQAVGVG
ncbi:MAG: flagellar biosynthetic protein FliO [Bacteroidota bacterium]